jgi:hypothetical protein
MYLNLIAVSISNAAVPGLYNNMAAAIITAVDFITPRVILHKKIDINGYVNTQIDTHKLRVPL